MSRPGSRRTGRAREFGVRSEAIVLEPMARSTIENAERVAARLHDQGLRSVLVVTSPSHVRRAGFVFSLTEIGYAVRPSEPSTELR